MSRLEYRVLGPVDLRADGERLAVPVLLVNGTRDPINPYGGGDVILPPELGGHDLGPVLPSEDAARLLATLAGHRSPPHVRSPPDADGDPTTALRHQTWTAPGRPEVTLVTIVGGGHTIPQPDATFPPVAGPHSGDLDTPAEAWRSFARFATEQEPR